eukprot:TRINITY_DN4198_c0_g1_i1.p1 TRINITY_DN4198_c0_g1~~TRINITY_DN4198_c0_g1_i1.p1  ORF type:complete len:977 (+),score=148.29 TRINITY_DN4198_c0_g1_i1:80-3010(+)
MIIHKAIGVVLCLSHAAAQDCAGRCGHRCVIPPPQESLSNAVIHGFCGADGVTCQRDEPKCSCPTNAEWLTCASACPKVCGQPDAVVCTEQCVIGCQCKDGFARLPGDEGPAALKVDAVCVPAANCPVVDPLPVPLPGVPVANCPANAVWQECGSACPGVCGQPPPQLCTMQCVVGCQCKVGFVRKAKDNAECIAEEECKRVVVDPVPVDKFNCFTREVWTAEKSQWCCEKKNLGCPVVEPAPEQQCPPFAEWQDCGAACPATCGMPTDVPCIEMCVAGCQCKEGYQRLNKEGMDKGLTADNPCVKTCGIAPPVHDADRCLPSTGQSWCEKKKKCVREFEEPCDEDAPKHMTVYGVATKVSDDQITVDTGRGEYTFQVDSDTKLSGATSVVDVKVGARVAVVYVPDFKAYHDMKPHDGLKLSAIKAGDGDKPPPPLPRRCDETVASIRVMPGSYVPQCDEKEPALYQKMQCHSSSGHCWCVDQKSGEATSEKKGPGEERPKCDEPRDDDAVVLPRPGRCDTLLAATQSMPGAYVPQCDDADPARWVETQCHGSSGYCWCVDTETGEVKGEKHGPGKRPDCSKPVLGRPTGQCVHGYQWCPAKAKCLRPHEEDCDENTLLDVYGIVVASDESTVTVKVGDQTFVFKATDDVARSARQMHGHSVRASFRPDSDSFGDRKAHDGAELRAIESVSGGGTAGLKEGDVCKSGGVETGPGVDRKNDCPPQTRCRPGPGMALGGEVAWTCQKTRPERKQHRIAVVGKHVPLAEAIGKAKKLAEAVLRSFAATPEGKHVVRVLIPYVCELPAARAAAGPTDADRISSLCSSTDSAEAASRAATVLGDTKTVWDVQLMTDGDEQSSDPYSTAIRESSEVQTAAGEIEQVQQTSVAAAVTQLGSASGAKDGDEGKEGSEEGDNDDGVGRKLGIALASLSALFCAGTVALVVTRRRAGQAKAAEEAKAESTPVVQYRRGSGVEMGSV